MQECRNKYKTTPAVRTSPMVDAPVILAMGRTSLELFGPFLLASLTMWKFGVLGLLPVLALFFLLPLMREHWGRNRLVQWFWGMGWRRSLLVTSKLMAFFGVPTGDPVPTPFERERTRRFGP